MQGQPLPRGTLALLPPPVNHRAFEEAATSGLSTASAELQVIIYTAE